MPRPFRQSLSDGHAAEKAWVEEQHGHSLAVAHGVRIVADNFNPAKDHLQHPDAAGVFRIEIKNRGIRFTSKEDYPYDTVFLANIANHHKDLTSPLIYVLRSEPTGSFGFALQTVMKHGQQGLRETRHATQTYISWSARRVFFEHRTN